MARGIKPGVLQMEWGVESRMRMTGLGRLVAQLNGAEWARAREKAAQLMRGG